MILQTHIPYDVSTAKRLPGVAPLDPAKWLVTDDAHAAQMAERDRLLRDHRDEVLALRPEGHEAAQELLDMVPGHLPEGYTVDGDAITRPDGVTVALDRDDPLGALGRVVQEDLCLMQRLDGAEHVLTGAVLCFPARWMLAEKIGRPLMSIHVPVPEYDAGVGARVQRLFDGVQVGRPLWRWNAVLYDDAALFQPCSETQPRATRHGRDETLFLRSERQVLWRLPATQAVVFSIHTYVIENPARQNPA